MLCPPELAIVKIDLDGDETAAMQLCEPRDRFEAEYSPDAVRRFQKMGAGHGRSREGSTIR